MSKGDEVDQFLLGKTRTSSSEETGGLDQPDRCGANPARLGSRSYLVVCVFVKAVCGKTACTV
jgi:hypothetical protein